MSHEGRSTVQGLGLVFSDFIASEGFLTGSNIGALIT